MSAGKALSPSFRSASAGVIGRLILAEAAITSSSKSSASPSSNSKNCRRIRGSQNLLMCSATPAMPSSRGFEWKKVAIWLAMRTSFSLVLAMWSSSCDMLGNSGSHPVGVGENIEIVAAHQRHQRHAGGLGRADGKCGRRGNGHNDGGADGGRLLHHLHRHTRGDDDGAARAVEAGFRQRASELVQRIVA